MICSKCKSELTPGAQVCLKCGQPVSEKPLGFPCVICGAPIPPGTDECLQCGGAVSHAPAVEQGIEESADTLTSSPGTGEIELEPFQLDDISIAPPPPPPPPRRTHSLVESFEPLPDLIPRDSTDQSEFPTLGKSADPAATGAEDTQKAVALPSSGPGSAVAPDVFSTPVPEMKNVQVTPTNLPDSKSPASSQVARQASGFSQNPDPLAARVVHPSAPGVDNIPAPAPAPASQTVAVAGRPNPPLQTPRRGPVVPGYVPPGGLPKKPSAGPVTGLQGGQLAKAPQPLIPAQAGVPNHSTPVGKASTASQLASGPVSTGTATKPAPTPQNPSVVASVSARPVSPPVDNTKRGPVVPGYVPPGAEARKSSGNDQSVVVPQAVPARPAQPAAVAASVSSAQNGPGIVEPSSPPGPAGSVTEVSQVPIPELQAVVRPQVSTWPPDDDPGELGPQPEDILDEDIVRRKRLYMVGGGLLIGLVMLVGLGSLIVSKPWRKVQAPQESLEVEVAKRVANHNVPVPPPLPEVSPVVAGGVADASSPVGMDAAASQPVAEVSAPAAEVSMPIAPVPAVVAKDAPNPSRAKAAKPAARARSRAPARTRSTREEDAYLRQIRRQLKNE